MPQTGLGIGTRDTLDDLLKTIETSPKLHRLIDSTLDGDGRGVLLRCECHVARRIQRRTNVGAVLTSGYRLLASDFMLDDTWITTHFPMCENSKACLLSLVAFQSAIDVQLEEAFGRYYDQA